MHPRMSGLQPDALLLGDTVKMVGAVAVAATRIVRLKGGSPSTVALLP